MSLKSLVLRVTSTKSCISAVAAMMASGVLILYFCDNRDLRNKGIHERTPLFRQHTTHMIDNGVGIDQKSLSHSSIGAGSAIVEKVLAKELNVEVTVVDFPDAIKLNQQYYDHLGFHTISGDLLNDTIELSKDTYELLLSAEIIEHIPKSPYEQLLNFKDAIKQGGKIMITTPNMGSIAHIGKLILMRPLLPPAEQTFSPVSFENEGVHRREYMAREIVEALKKLNFRHLHTRYIYYGPPQHLINRPLFALGKVIPNNALPGGRPMIF